MNKERLTILRDYLKTNVADDKFGMSMFFSGDQLRVIPGDNVATPVIGCGTAACMAGWACVVPGFVGLGLAATLEDQYIRKLAVPRYNEANGFDALSSFFEISMLEAEYLFDMSSGSNARVPRDRSEWTVADGVAHLTDFIDNHEDALNYIDGAEVDDDC